MYSGDKVRLRGAYILPLAELQRLQHARHLRLLKLAPLPEELRTLDYTIMVILKEYFLIIESSLKLRGSDRTSCQ